jgi:hypothetical protein
MPGEINYKVRFDTDVSGLNRATSSLRTLGSEGRGALDSLAMRGGAAQAAFIGVKQAAEGNVMAIFSVARAAKYLIGAISPITFVMAALMGAWAALNHYAKKAEESIKVFNEQTKSTKSLYEAIDNLIAKQNAVTYSIDAQVKALETIKAKYDSTAGAAIRYADAQKKIGDASATWNEAGIDLRQAKGLIAAGGNQSKIDAVNLQADTERRLNEYTKNKNALEADQGSVLARQGPAVQSWWDAKNKLAPSPDIAAAKAELNSLAGGLTAPGSDEEKKKRIQSIAELQDKIKVLEKQEEARLAIVEKEVEEKKALMDQLDVEVLANKDLLAANEKKYQSAKLQLQLQEKINAAKTTEAALQKQLTAETERGEAIKKAGEESIPKLKKKADLAKTASDNAAKILKDPDYRKAQDKEARDRSGAVANATRLAERMGKTFTPGADETAQDIKDRMAIARAMDAQRRGARGAGINRVLSAADAREASKAADAALQNADAKFKQDMSEVAANTKVIADNIKSQALGT